MRVTKVIKEYIERKVNEAYPLPTKKDTIHEELEELREEVEIFYKNKVVEFVEKHQGKIGVGFGASLNQTLEEAKRYLDEHLHVSTCNFVTEEDILYKKELEKVRIMRRESVNNIIITLELVGSKAELDTMLKELMEKKA
jgi:pyruvate/2-oxoacid:ferredoxin oxidoreductase alpha subunit